MKRHIILRLAALIAVLGTLACGPPPPPRVARGTDLRSLSEARAVELISEVLTDSSLAAEAGWAVGVGMPEALAVDIKLTGTTFGIEWVSAQDRQSFGDVVPEPAPSGQLRILPGDGDDATAQILVLEHATYRYDPDRQRVQHGAVGIREAESRLRRDIRDFLEYARGQGAL